LFDWLQAAWQDLNFSAARLLVFICRTWKAGSKFAHAAAAELRRLPRR
jgi:hypothetical protein